MIRVVEQLLETHSPQLLHVYLFVAVGTLGIGASSLGEILIADSLGIRVAVLNDSAETVEVRFGDVLLCWWLVERVG